MEPKRSKFSSLLVGINHLDRLGFHRWLFPPGTGYREAEKWWAVPELRPAPHEGLGFCYFLNREGESLSFGAYSLVPALFEGRIIAVLDDFLGKSVMMGHDIHDRRNRQLHSLCAHLLPDGNLKAGQQVSEGVVIGTVAPAGKSRVPPHLHLSTIWIPEERAHERISWQEINNGTAGELSNPLDFLEPV